MGTKKSAIKAQSDIRVRMYRHGLGDCFLIRLPKDDGTALKVLIDCGLIGVAQNPKPKMTAVVGDIKKECDGAIDVVVMTHEHWDHASGFSTEQVQQEFDQLKIGEVWYAWTEDPKSTLGTKLRKERAAKLQALQAAALALRSMGSPLALERASNIEGMLQFFGIGNQRELAAAHTSAKGGAVGKTRAAFEYLGRRPDVRTRYCYPDKDPITFDGMSGIRIYVLGPPQDEGLIKRSSPTKKGKEVYEFAVDAAVDENLGIAFERALNFTGPGGPDCPFDSGLSIVPDRGPIPPKLSQLMAATWDEANAEWRRIEDDWTAVAETLALNLDSHTNNTCLVIAIEIVKTGKVLLFPADAQVGNWLSWQEVSWQVPGGGQGKKITGPDLLQRTVFYKVGHHGSHNATLRALGLEEMVSEELVAFVPVFKAQAVKNRWMGMPFPPLVKRLEEKTGGRLVFSDDAMPKPTAGDMTLSKEQKQTFLGRLKVNSLYYEYSLPA